MSHENHYRVVVKRRNKQIWGDYATYFEAQRGLASLLETLDRVSAVIGEPITQQTSTQPVRGKGYVGLDRYYVRFHNNDTYIGIEVESTYYKRAAMDAIIYIPSITPKNAYTKFGSWLTRIERMRNRGAMTPTEFEEWEASLKEDVGF